MKKAEEHEKRAKAEAIHSSFNKIN